MQTEEGNVIFRAHGFSGDRTPLPAIILGGSSVLPLMISVCIVAVAPDAFGLPVVHIAIVYAAVILSFLGGMYWGMASAILAADPGAAAPYGILACSVVPALIGWVAVFLPSPIGPGVLAVTFVAVLMLDRRCRRLGYVAGWWMELRIWLTSFVVPLLVLLAFLGD
jgi:hypothetical protein